MNLLRRITEDEPRPIDRRDALFFLVVLLFFFVSGASGLLYQVVWTRKLVLLFGAASYAISTVLSIFFLGLGLGSLWGGRVADRTPRPLFLYGIFEIIIGLWAVGFIFFIDAGEAWVVSALSSVSASRPLAIVVRMGLALAFLIVPVTLMGATLPLLARFVTREAAVRGRRIGALYAFNTFGAVSGCALTGFVLLANLGYTNTTFVGAAANMIVGLAACALARGVTERAEPARSVGATPSAAHHESSAGQRTVGVLVIAAFALSGFCALALEVLWTRLLTILFLGTTYAYTAMLTALLCGLALGSVVAAFMADRRKHPVSLLGAVQALAGVACLLMLSGITLLPGFFRIHGFAELPEVFDEARLHSGFEWDQLVWINFRLAFLTMFVPTFLFGMSFPLAVKAAVSSLPRLGRDLGRLYSANTFGGVLGALAAGYLIIPRVGTHWGIVALAGALCLSGVLLAIVCPTRSLKAKAAIVVVLGLLAAWAWYTLPDNIGRAMNAAYLPAEEDKIIHFAEGLEGTVAVSEKVGGPEGAERTLWINGVQATASIEKGVKMNRLQGVLPLLFDRDPRKVLFMCFGSGITAGTLALYDGFERFDAVEISRDVLEAAHNFEADNFDVINNPKVNFVVDDGRNFLLTTRNAYDVITFEPMPLALAGVSTFYTREYYELCLEHLTPGGIVSQWVPLHSLNPELVRSLMYTFTTVFPYYTAWFINADLFLIGSNQPLAIDYARAGERLAQPVYAEALDEVYLKDLPEVVTCFFMGKEGIDNYTKGGRVMTDDRPWAEFIAPKLVYERHVEEAIEELRPLYESPVPYIEFAAGSPREQIEKDIERRHRAKANDLAALKQYYGGMVGAYPEDAFIASLEIDPHDYNALYYLKEMAGARVPVQTRWEEFDQLIEYLDKLMSYAPDEPFFHLMLGDVYAAKEDQAAARDAYSRYLEMGGTARRAQDFVQQTAATVQPALPPPDTTTHPAPE